LLVYKLDVHLRDERTKAWEPVEKALFSPPAKLTLRLLMSYIYGAPILDVSRSHTTTHYSR